MNYVERTKQKLQAYSCAVRGKPGKSAYEVAVQEGYTGSKEQWLASLVGPQGPQGIQGTGALIVNDQSSNLPAALDATATVSASDLYDVNATPAAGDIVIGSYTGRICLATSAVSEGSFGVKGTGKTLMAALVTTVGQHEEQINGLDTAIDVLNGEKHLVYCASDVPTQPGYQHYTTVLKSQFSPEPKSGDAVLGRNMYFGVVVSISGNDVALGGSGIALLPKNFDVLSSLSVLAVNGVGGDIDADGKLTVTGDASVGGKLSVGGVVLKAISGALSVIGNVSASGDLYGTNLNLTNANNKSVQLEVSAENVINLNGTSDAPVKINNVETPTESGQAANKAFAESVVTAARVVTATGAMTDEQKSQTRANLGATDASTSIPDNVKIALLNCLSKVAWIDDDGQDYYDALEAALYPPANLVSISAVFTQGQTVVYDTDSLDVLKPMLTVTALYDDTTSEEVTTYTLTGTLTAGTSTITVLYGGETTTFTVTVTHVIAVFEANAIGKSTSNPYLNYMWKTPASARARMTAPIANNNYVFTVTDNTKYQLVAYDPTSNVTENISKQAYTGPAYPGGTKSISWKDSDSASTQYVWLALKKLDNTEFTDEELANGAAAVFTYTEGA